jgi:hypothetical protein
MTRRLLLPLLMMLAALVWGAAGASANERILNFAADITIAEDGVVHVIEEITVRASGRDIRRGIVREFPTRYRDPRGLAVTVDFEVVSVTRDGRPEGWFTERARNGVEIYIGRRDVILPPGEYTYHIAYRVGRAISHFDEFDELYWNVTGTGWAFAIDRAAATIRLPGNARALERAAYTGPQGARGAHFTFTEDSPGLVAVETTRSLAPREGLTVAVAWPKGIVAEPSAVDRASRYMRDNAGFILAAAGFVGLFAYYLYFWRRVGRGPARGTIIPRYDPPEGLSPAACRFIRRMSFDNKALAAAVINMGVKGFLTIDEEKRKSFRLTKASGDWSVLSPGEAALGKELLHTRSSIPIQQSNHAVLSKAIAAMRKALSREYEGRFFNTNAGYLYTGMIISGLIITASFILATEEVLVPVIALAAGMAAVNLVFWFLMRAPTMAGREVMDEIEGFAMYLGTAEQHRLDLLNPPEKTPELFEKYLPYALALDVENRWSEQFADILARASADGGAYQPRWYRGTSFARFGAARFGGQLASSMASTIAAASVAPSSGAGSRGGGMSGGGFGGGGGRGW